MTPGKLYVAATPIGNMEDITLRALRVMKEAGFITAENTRHAGKLLSRYGIKTPVILFSRDKNKRRADEIINRVLSGEDCVLITNAGTPGISDPGGALVRAAAAAGVRVEAVPGPSAIVAAVSLSGFPCSNFVFLGFLSPKSGRRKKELARFASFDGSIILYESPHRLVKLLYDIREVLGERYVAVCRELTKKFEETVRGGVSSVIEVFEERAPRGEFTVIAGGRMTGEERE